MNRQKAWTELSQTQALRENTLLSDSQSPKGHRRSDSERGALMLTPRPGFPMPLIRMTAIRAQSHELYRPRRCSGQIPSSQEKRWVFSGHLLTWASLLSSSSQTQQRQQKHLSYKPTPQVQPLQSWKGFAFVSMYNHVRSEPLAKWKQTLPFFNSICFVPRRDHPSHLRHSFFHLKSQWI